MISWEATIAALVGSAAGIWPGAILGRALAHALVRHGIAPPTFSVTVCWLQVAAVIGGGVTAALLAVLAAGRRAARVPPTHALADAAVQPRLLGPGRVIGGLLALAARRFSSASTPLVLTVAMSCTLLFSTTTQDHAVTQQRQAGLSSELAITSTGPGMPAAALAHVRGTAGVHSAVALTPTTLGPSLGISDDTISAMILNGGQGGGFDPGVSSGSLAALHGDAIALGRQRADAVHAHVGDRVAVMLGDGTRTHATVAAIYTRALAFGDALLAPELAAGHQRTSSLGMILVHTANPAAVAHRLQALAARYPGLRVNDRASLSTATVAERETNRWLGPLFVLIIFAFTSIAVINTLTMIALQRGRELALLRLVGGTRGQVRSMARWEAGLIVAIGLGLAPHGLAAPAAVLLAGHGRIAGTAQAWNVSTSHESVLLGRRTARRVCVDHVLVAAQRGQQPGQRSTSSRLSRVGAGLSLTVPTIRRGGFELDE